MAKDCLSRTWLIDEISKTAKMAGRLMVSHRDPEAFFVQRSEVVERLQMVVNRLQADGSSDDLGEAGEAK